MTCTGCYLGIARFHLAECPRNPSVRAEQEAPPVTFPPNRRHDYADRIAATHVAAEFPLAASSHHRVTLTAGRLRELLANAAREGYVNGIGVAA